MKSVLLIGLLIVLLLVVMLTLKRITAPAAPAVEMGQTPLMELPDSAQKKIDELMRQEANQLRELEK